MTTDRPRLPRMAWTSAVIALICLAAASSDIAQALDGHPSPGGWWAIPVNLACVVANLLYTRGFVRRARRKQQHEQRT